MSTDEESELELTPERAFAVLGHETRLAILFELWKQRRPDEHVPQHPMTFSALRKSLGMRDGSQFNYHLKPLVNRFVHHAEDGYILRREGERVVSAILAGAFTDEVVFDAVPSDKPCEICGGQTVFECNTDRTLGYFAIRCTECEGAFGGTGFDGALSLTESLLPVGTRSRNPEEFYQALDIMVKHQIMSAVEGSVPTVPGP
ncbi:winged helix-turn-helix domain-containing protein [Halobacteriaceae archaeon GCM10025711]